MVSPGLNPGDRVVVEILETSGKGEGWVRVGERVVRGLFPESLPQGARMSLQVVNPGPPLHLSATEGKSAALPGPPSHGLAAAIRVLLQPPAGAGSGGSGGAEILSTMRRVLGLPQDPEALAKALAGWVGRFGLSRKAPVAHAGVAEDLKTLTLKILARKPEGELARAARALLGHVEAHQARSVLEGVLIVPLVLPWGDDWIQGELWVEDESGRDPAEKRLSGRLRMRLQMPQLGPVEVRLRWGKGAVAVRFAADPKALEPIRSHLGELAAALAHAPNLSVTELRADPLPPPEPNAGPGLVEVLA